MNNSFILNVILKIYYFFANAYEYSFFNKLCIGVANFFKKITKNSFFVNFFSAPSNNDCFKGSKIFSFFGKILSWLRKVFSKLAVPFKNSTVIGFFNDFYSNILNYSISHFAIVIISATAVYTVLKGLSGGMTPLMYAVGGFAVIFGIICGFLNTSVYNLFTGSIAVKLLSRLFDKCEFENRETVYLNKTGKIVCVVLGVLLAVSMAVSSPIYALAFIFGIFALGWILYDYTVGIFISAVILPFAPTMALVGLTIFTFMSFVLRFIFDENMTFKRTALDLPVLLFGVMLIVSAVTSFAPKASIMSVLVYLAFMLSYYLLTNSVRSKERLFTIIVLMLFAGLLVALYGIYQYVFGFAEGTTWIDEDMFSDIETRVVSTFENPNVLGEYLLLLIPVGLAVIWGTKKGYNKLIHLCVVGALSLCMIYTYSRGCWIGLMVAVMMFFMFYDRRFVWLGIIALLMSPMFLPQNVINRFLSVGDMGDTSTSYRVYIWMGTFNMLKDYWFSGIGVGTEAFGRIYPMYAYSGVMAPHSHNLYLQIITENGIAGLIIFLSIVVVYFKECISSIIRSKDKLLKGLITGLAAGMLGYLVQGMFDNVWYNYRVFLLFFIILGITISAIEICRCTERSAEDD